MNTYFEAPKFVEKWSAVILTAGLVLASIIPSFTFPQVAQAAKPEYGIAISSSSVVGQTVNLSGTVTSTDFAGQLSQYHVDIFWSDGAESNNVHSLTQSGNDFSGTWTGGHTFSSGGLKTIIISLCHQNCTGAEGADATVEFEVVLPSQCFDGVDNDGDTFIDYPSDPGCDNASDDDEFNPPSPVLGCTDPNANNFNPDATEDDGSCTYDPAPVLGCMDPEATNYNPNATQDDGSCTYPVPGCTNPVALNYNPLATVDDGSCIFPPVPPDPVPGCMDESALNYNPNATEDNGSCTYPVLGCTNPNATNYNPLATPGNNDAGECTFPSTPPETPSNPPSTPIDEAGSSGSSRPPSDGGQVLGASIGQVLGESCGLYMGKFIRSGKNNDVEQVKKLQTFLNKWMNSSLPITGFYGPLTLKALESFQEKFAGEILAPWGLTSPTGIVYLTTIRQINMLECPALTLEIPVLVEWSKNPNAPR